MDYSSMDNDALTAALAEKREKAAEIFALTSPTIEQVDEVVAITASIKEIETEQGARAAAVREAAERFAAARAEFSVEETEDEDETEDEAEAETEETEADEAEETESVEAAAETDTDDTEEEGEVVTAAVDHTRSQTVKAPSAAKAVARKTPRPVKRDTPEVVITAAADIPNVPMGSNLASMSSVAEALQARVSGFAPYNARSAEMAAQASGGAPVLSKFAVASFKTPFKSDHVGGKGDADYNATKAAVDSHKEALVASMNAASAGRPVDALTAAGWCAPSEVVYNWIADYVVDGLISIPEVSAPRGGLMLTEGPQLAQGTFADPDAFGFGGTEAQAIAGYTKTCETIECPGFVDYRLDFDGYCWKIPILTESAFPELVADAMRLTDVLYAHKMNGRYIRDIIAASTAVNATPYGGSAIDTLEALTQIAVKERRWWNIGENAVMEVKLPQFARDVFKFDMARRSGLALNDVATDQKVAAHFANFNLAVEYVADFEDLSGAAAAQADWPGSFRAIIYPAGTFVRATKDVINLSAVYDAASLSENEYTGVFFEQGVKVIKRGYRSHVVDIPVCTSGTTGANAFVCEGGSF